MSYQSAKLHRFATIFGLCALTVGCSPGPKADYSKLGLLEISGTITLDGQPVPKAAIFFYREDETYSYGITDAEGRYTAMLNSEKSGVLPGPKRIEISTVHSPIPGGLSDNSGDGEAEFIEEDPDLPAKRKNKGEKIPACYNSKTNLKVEINQRDAHLDFDLQSDCSTTSAS